MFLDRSVIYGSGLVCTRDYYLGMTGFALGVSSYARVRADEWVFRRLGPLLAFFGTGDMVAASGHRYSRGESIS